MSMTSTALVCPWRGLRLLASWMTITSMECGAGSRFGCGCRRGVESRTVVGPDGRPAVLVDEFLDWLTGIERSPKTVEGYARDLAAFWSFLTERGVEWDRVSVVGLGEFAAWARRPAPNVLVLNEQAARRSASTVNRMLSAVVSFYEFQGRRGTELATDLVVRTRSGRGGYKPFLHGIARERSRGRAVRLPQRQRLPRTLSLEQVAAVIDCQQRLRDRFSFALLASTGMRVGQALGLRHEDVVRGSGGSRSCCGRAVAAERGQRAARRARCRCRVS